MGSVKEDLELGVECRCADIDNDARYGFATGRDVIASDGATSESLNTLTSDGSVNSSSDVLVHPLRAEHWSTGFGLQYYYAREIPPRVRRPVYAILLVEFAYRSICCVGSCPYALCCCVQHYRRLAVMGTTSRHRYSSLKKFFRSSFV